MLETRFLGATQLAVSRIGLGLAALGRPGYINLGHAEDLQHDYDVDDMRRRTFHVLDEAAHLGIRYFDAARSYGRAEEFLAGWLNARERSPDQIVVGSKWGYTYTANWRVDADVHEVKDHSLSTLQRQFAESRALLDPWLRLYQVHSATRSSGILDREDVLDQLADLRRSSSLVIGITLSGEDSGEMLERALDITRDGRRLFETVQVTWNAFEQSLGVVLGVVHGQGIGVIVKEALANGRLTARNENPDFRVPRSVLERESERLQCSIDQLALAYVLDQPWVDCVLSGAATAEHLRSNVAAASVRLDDRAREALAALAEPSADYWRTRSALPWT